jgi:uroporphyrinogen III methyltransferase/synthase
VSGIVYLVGAGPGDPGLLTVRGQQVLARADVLVYDRLVAPELVERAPPEAERVYVGKAPGRHTLRQDEINTLLVERARAGRFVVRLKGGDPFVFGRGGEEAATLAAAGVPFEIVPGVTAAVAVAAYAGIPVTHRAVASSFAVATGQEGEARGPQCLAYDRLAAAADTLVLLMGVERLPAIVADLLAAGRPPETPVAVIQAGTLPEQRTVVATLYSGGHAGRRGRARAGRRLATAGRYDRRRSSRPARAATLVRYAAAVRSPRAGHAHACASQHAHRAPARPGRAARGAADDRDPAAR